MSNQDYMPVECLLVPKALFKDARYCSLSTTAKVLYSLMLDRLRYAAQNRWIDQKGKLYVIYPKSERIRDLNSTRYRVDYAVSELESMGNMVLVVKDNGSGKSAISVLACPLPKCGRGDSGKACCPPRHIHIWTSK